MTRPHPYRQALVGGIATALVGALIATGGPGAAATTVQPSTSRSTSSVPINYHGYTSFGA